MFYIHKERAHLFATNSPCRPASTPSEGKKQHAMRSNVWATIHKEGCGTKQHSPTNDQSEKERKKQVVPKASSNFTSSVARKIEKGRRTYIHTEYVVGAQLILITGAHLAATPSKQPPLWPCNAKHATELSNTQRKAKIEDRRSLLLL